MPRKSFTPEQVIAKLRHIEVALANGKTLPLDTDQYNYASPVLPTALPQHISAQHDREACSDGRSNGPVACFTLVALK
jgi:hypothetical protein